MPPSGGPPDEIPPWLVAAWPESASTGHGPIDELRFEFSEKMDRQGAFRWLQTYPRRTIGKTGWKGARTATVRLQEPLPADSVVVVEILPGMKDSHGVPQPRGRLWAIATGDSLPDGSIGGNLVLEEKPLVGAVVELLPAGPDSVRLQQRPVLRRATTDSLGAYRFTWLPAAGERWLLRTYDDRNGNRRPDESEAQRLWPDTLALDPGRTDLALGIRTLYPPTAPGVLEGRLAGRPAQPGRVLAFTQKITEDQPDFDPQPQPRGGTAGQAVPDTGLFTLKEAGPGLVRAVFYVDVDGDSLLSPVPLPPDSLWFLEPWALVDSLLVEPGLKAALPAPVWPDTLTPWSAPAADSLHAAPDSAGAASGPAIAETDTLIADPRED